MRTIKSKCLLGVLVLSAAMASCQKTGPDTGMVGGTIVPRLATSALTKAGASVLEQDALFEYSDEEISVTLFEEGNLSGICDVPTKGAVVTTEGLNKAGQGFLMNAWLGSENRYDGTQDGDGRVYDASDKGNYHFISSETVSYSSGSWSMGAEYSWRSSVPTSFWSLYPVSVTDWDVTLPGDTASDDEQKQISFDYTIPSSADGDDAVGQPDLCVAFSYKTWEDGTDHYVDIDFKHALSAVLFDVTDIPDGISVTKIAIIGLKGSGSCTVTGSTSGNSSAKGVTFGWTTSGDNCSWSQSFGDSDFETSGGRRVTKESGSKIFMLIPQTLTADTKLSVTFYDGTNSTTREASIGDGSTSFKAGKRYTFRLGVKEGELTAGLPDPYNGDPLGGTDVGGEGLDPYSGDPLGGTDIGGGGLDPYSGDPLGGTV